MNISDVKMTNGGENLRVINYGDSIINLNRVDPHGFWYVKFNKGNVPENLSGAYTSASAAYNDVRLYIENNSRRQLNFKKAQEAKVKEVN